MMYQGLFGDNSLIYGASRCRKAAYGLRQHPETGLFCGCRHLQIRTFLSRRKGFVLRDFGISRDYIDLSLTGAMACMVVEIGRQLEKYVPHIKVRDIVF